MTQNIFKNADDAAWKLIRLPIKTYSGLVIIASHIGYKVKDFFFNL